MHRSNTRLEEDLALTVKWKAPIVITSLGAREDVNQAVQGYGGVTLHDVINQTFARKAIEKGANGLICVAAGAGGHAGALSPFAFVAETREWFDGPLALSGAIATGGGVLAAQAMGADFAYIGSAFIATDEARAAPEYKQAIVEGAAADIVGSDLFTGVFGNYLRPSIVRAGLDPDNLPKGDVKTMNFESGRRLQGQGVARHLGLRPGHRRGQARSARRRQFVDDAAAANTRRRSGGSRLKRPTPQSARRNAAARAVAAGARGLDAADDDGVGVALQDFLDAAFQRASASASTGAPVAPVAPGALARTARRPAPRRRIGAPAAPARRLRKLTEKAPQLASGAA